MRYTLVYSVSFEQDLTVIFTNIADYNMHRADNFINDVEQELLRLTDFPHIGRDASEYDIPLIDSQIILCDKYFIFYTVDEDIKAIQAERILPCAIINIK